MKNALGNSLNLSVSAANTWEDCNLKWLFGYYYRIEQAPKESLIVGNGVHDLLESYLQTGQWLLEGESIEPKHRFRRLAERALDASGLTVIPGEGVQDGWVAEEWTPKDLKVGPLNFKGKVDIHRVHEGRLQIWDWKTSKNPLASYNPTPYSLGRLRQPLAYGYAMSHKYGLMGQDFDARYIYVSITGQDAFPVDADGGVPFDRAAEEWERLIIMAHNMADIVKNVSSLPQELAVKEVPHNTGSCRKYGGCDYRAICPFSPENKIKEGYQAPIDTTAIQQEKLNMSNLANLAALGKLAGINMPTASKPEPKPEPKAPAPPPSDDPADKATSLALQLQAMLQTPAFAAGIPASMVAGMATGVGIDAEAALTAWKTLAAKEDHEVVCPHGRYLEQVAQALPELAAGMSLSQVVDIAEAQGVTIGTLLEDSGLVASCGLAITEQDVLDCSAMEGAEKVAHLYRKYQTSDAAEVIAEVEANIQAHAPEPEPEPTAPTTEMEYALAWFEELVWPAEGLPIAEVRQGLLDAIPGRKRLGAVFIKKVVDAFNGSESLLEIAEDHVRPVLEGDEAVVPTATPEPEPKRNVVAMHAPEPDVIVVESTPHGEGGQPFYEASVSEPEPEEASPFADLPDLIVLVDVALSDPSALFEAVELEAWASEYEGQVLDLARRLDWTGHELGSWQLIDYGKGAAAYGMVFRECLASGDHPSVVSVDSRSPLAATFLAAARAIEATVIRGRS